ncbi:MAG TPA: hypothetical protein P5110_07885 [Candidatus Omnitrophota bacterium]|nr:hypothetical protein [Candidatus Omnitrophota bacterium]HRZ15412.1 hypothetical protein [Candidatus Omnitrophota bacterium]
MNKVNQIVLSAVLVFLLIAIPVQLILNIRQHDAKLCDSMVACHVAYKTLSAYTSCAAQYRKLMIVPTKVDATILEKDAENIRKK